MLTLDTCPNHHIQNRFFLLERSLESSLNMGAQPLPSAPRALTRESEEKAYSSTVSPRLGSETFGEQNHTLYVNR